MYEARVYQQVRYDVTNNKAFCSPWHTENWLVSENSVKCLCKLVVCGFLLHVPLCVQYYITHTHTHTHTLGDCSASLNTHEDIDKGYKKQFWWKTLTCLLICVNWTRTRVISTRCFWSNVNPTYRSAQPFTNVVMIVLRISLGHYQWGIL